MAPPDDQEIARWREPTEELELFEFESQLSIDEEEEKLEEEGRSTGRSRGRQRGFVSWSGTAGLNAGL
jgi:hypothetical protein